MSDEQQKEVPAAAAAKPAVEKKVVTEMAAGEKPAAEKPARPAKPPKEEAPPDPRAIAAQEVMESIRKKIEAEFGADVLEETKVAKFTPTFVVKKQFWVEVVSFLKDEPTLNFSYLECMAGTDYPANNAIEVVIFLQSLSQSQSIFVKVRADRDNPVLPTLVPVFRGVEWEEREIFDLLGVTFTGHPDLRRIMLPDDWKGYPLRKDYSVMD